MKLVECLVSGIAGAESGTATFVLRGTASSAASVLYNDFEGTTQPGTNIITLDSNGCAEVYVNAYCDMTLKTQAGSTLRTVTVGDSATTVEVISDSFTGTDYSGSPTAVSEPITLAAILDKWNNSAGQPDWKVDIGGVSTNISSAFASLTGIFINVKDPTYGATGDGVTDDTTAISNALTAANSAGGSIVYFPAGTYNVSSITITARNYYLLGSGPGASIISATSAGDQLFTLDNTVEGFGTVSQLGFKAVASVNQCFEITPTQNVQFINCHFDLGNFGIGLSHLDFDGGSLVMVNGCIFTVDSNCTAAISNFANDRQCTFLLSNCVFNVEASFTGDILSGPDFVVNSCTFDASAVTSGTYYHIDSQSSENPSTYVGNFTNNVFIDGGSSGFVFDLRLVAGDCKFCEFGNTFIGFTDPTAMSSSGQIYDFSVAAGHATTSNIQLGGRIDRTLSLTNSASSTGTMTAAIMADTLVIDHTNASNLTLTPSAVCLSGTKFNVIVLNNSGGTRTITFEGSGGQSVATTSVADGGRAFASLFNYLESTGAESTQVLTAIDLKTAT